MDCEGTVGVPSLMRAVDATGGPSGFDVNGRYPWLLICVRWTNQRSKEPLLSGVQIPCVARPHIFDEYASRNDSSIQRFDNDLLFAVNSLRNSFLSQKMGEQFPRDMWAAMLWITFQDANSNCDL